MQKKDIDDFDPAFFDPINISALAYSPNGNKLALCFGIIIDVYNVKHRKKIKRFINKGIVSSVKFINNKQLISSIYNIKDNKRYTNIKVFNLTSGECTKDIRCCFFPNNAISCSQDGMYCLESQSLYHNPTLWDINQQKCIKVFSKDKNEKVLSLAITHDNASCAIGTTKSKIKIFDAATEQLLTSFEEKNPTLLTFSPDTKLLICATDEKQDGIKVWDISSGTIIKQFIPECAINAFDCAPDNNTIAYTSIWDTWPNYFTINSSKKSSCLALTFEDIKHS